MWFVGLGLLFILMKWAEFGPVAAWEWWWVLSPFLAAIFWWMWADGTGYTKRREVEKMEARKEERRKKNLAALGMEPRKRR
ncbi:TIGR04438 family Trp-rich protein [Eleftheria terrae]|uniref:TIGR04438 family Trp-rich protein n=1 Tax=Eleftheria terrae TaxID=1597781 RepID=UPI00263BD358|nr:TIGR04438 family Trp-rich protein [Eleftheria terrae]WKB52655.1 TIGR04438 family Trp-rich protein [Eleftheria terrae]